VNETERKEIEYNLVSIYIGILYALTTEKTALSIEGGFVILKG
tara:strand:- start:9089 stop:9217 length:129 start_codon:yes stop_codon:yes gene_type:complete